MQDAGRLDHLALNESSDTPSSNRLQTQSHNELTFKHDCASCAAAAIRVAADATRIEDLELQLQSLSLKASLVGDLRD